MALNVNYRNLKAQTGQCICWLLLACGTVLGQQPEITYFSPTVGTPGDKVLISGSGFATGTIKVYFWNNIQAAKVVTSDSLLQATVPAGVTTGPIGIQRDSGAINYSPGDFVAVGSGPYISDFSPAYGGINDLVVINGVHFAGVSRDGVQFNGTPTTDASVNADGTQISMHVPAGTPAGAGPIKVTTPLGTSNSPVNFTVVGQGPFIAGFSPWKGSAGTTVLVDGMHFTGATGATFNDVAGKNFAVQSDTLLRVDAPDGVVTGPIAVTSPLGTATSSTNFFVAPVISTFSPGAGRAGTNVVLTGANFRGTTSVKFNGLGATYSVVNNTTINASVPVGATSGLIRVTTPGYSCFSANNFIVRPTVTGFSPGYGLPGTPVTITGANFNVGTPVVRFNGLQAATPTGVTFGQLTAVVPAGATSGKISVTTTDGSHTNGNNFYIPATISGFAPTNSPPGTSVTITGQNFLGTTAVSFNGWPAVFTVTNNTTIGATVPSGVTTGPITVTAPAGPVTSSGLFYGYPLIAGFNPTSGLPGTAVTITGTNFLGTTAVQFNGVPGGIISINNGEIVATVPAGAQTGPISVVAPAGTNTSPEDFSLNYNSNLEVWGTAAPDPGMVSSNLVYTITIQNHGPYDAPNTRVTNTLPSSVTLKAASISQGTLATNSNPIIGSLGLLPNGAVVSLVLTVVPRSGGTLIDVVSVGSDYPDSVPNNTFGIRSYVLPLPQLSIRWMTNQVKVSWPAALTNYSLEFNDTFPNSSSWAPVQTPPIVSGAEESITEPNTGTTRMYRLKK